MPPSPCDHRGRRLRKTNTLAHRVAHLIVCGSIRAAFLLLTFSRRAAPDMQRRAARITAEVFRVEGGIPGGRTATGSGTFHAIGARLLSASMRSTSGSNREFTS